MAATTEQTKPTADGLRIERRNALADIVLDRPEARNALSIGMRAGLCESFPGFARDANIYAVVVRSAVPGAFSVGGDVREMTGLARSDLAAARRGLADELQLCWLLECFSKPTVSLIDGAVMGTGVGISLYGTHRVAGAGYRFSMPEVRIGYFPDCAVVHAFARMPDSIGRYLGLTGRTIGRADALYLGLVTHCIDADRHEGIAACLADADPVDPLLDGLHRDPGPAQLAGDALRIRRFFEGGDVATIVARLERASPDDRVWADGILADLQRASPTALQVTERAIRNARDLDLRQCFVQDYRLAHRFAELADFHEGVRAVLIEKDGRPKWQPATLDAVTDATIDSLFAALGEDELALPTREQMQAARV
jgi:enoyl-CoA hydratase